MSRSRSAYVAEGDVDVGKEQAVDGHVGAAAETGLDCGTLDLGCGIRDADDA